MRARLLRDESGSVTAEFAIVLPVLLAVLGLVIAGILVSTHRVTLTSAAAEVARHEARGDAALAEARLGSLAGEREVAIARSEHDGMHCVLLRSRPVGGLLSGVEISARGCAARSGAGP